MLFYHSSFLSIRLLIFFSSCCRLHSPCFHRIHKSLLSSAQTAHHTRPRVSFPGFDHRSHMKKEVKHILDQATVQFHIHFFSLTRKLNFPRTNILYHTSARLLPRFRSPLAYEKEVKHILNQTRCRDYTDFLHIILSILFYTVIKI